MCHHDIHWRMAGYACIAHGLIELHAVCDTTLGPPINLGYGLQTGLQYMISNCFFITHALCTLIFNIYYSVYCTNYN